MDLNDFFSAYNILQLLNRLLNSKELSFAAKVGERRDVPSQRASGLLDEPQHCLLAHYLRDYGHSLNLVSEVIALPEEGIEAGGVHRGDVYRLDAERLSEFRAVMSEFNIAFIFSALKRKVIHDDVKV